MKRKRVPLTKLTMNIILKDKKIFGISKKLNSLIQSLSQLYKKEIIFLDIRKFSNKDPNLKGFPIVTKRNGDIRTIYLYPTKVFEDDIAHELFHIKLETYPDLFLKNPKQLLKEVNVTRTDLMIIRQAGNIILSALLDFEVDKLVEKEGFDIKKSNIRDKKGCLFEWKKDRPHDYIHNINLRKVIAGAKLAHMWNLLSSDEIDKIEKLANKKMPDAFKIASLFYSHGRKG